MLKVNTTVGTFSGWHGGIVASNIFLDKISKIDNGTFDTINDKFKTFATKLNAAFNINRFVSGDLVDEHGAAAVAH